MLPTAGDLSRFGAKGHLEQWPLGRACDGDFFATALFAFLLLGLFFLCVCFVAIPVCLLFFWGVYSIIKDMSVGWIIIPIFIWVTRQVNKLCN